LCSTVMMAMAATCSLHPILKRYRERREYRTLVKNAICYWWPFFLSFFSFSTSCSAINNIISER
jgi:hypothetical protein